MYIKNEQQLQEYADQWLRQLSQESNQATVVGLSGELGAGKTTFVQYIAKMLGVEEVPKSPTFVIMKKYGVTHDPQPTTYKQLIHIDAYRLSSGDELEILDWEAMRSDAENLILIEWPEHVQEILPSNVICMQLSISGEYGRAITSADL